MACTSWAEYCRLWSETGLFDDTKLFGTTYTHDCPVYYGIKGELFPIEISGNTATESVYIAKSNTLGEFFIGIPDINNTNNARSFQLMLKYCNPITALIDGCKCFTMSFQVKEQDSYFYTLDEVLSAVMNNKAEVYLLDAGANGINPSWQGKKEKQDLIDKYSNLPSRWLRAYVFDYSLEDITNAPKPHSQIRGKSISINDDKDTKPTDPLKAITPIMDAALARLTQSGDEAKINLAKAFKQVDKVESTLECGEDLFCLSETNPNDDVPIVFTGCVSRIKGKVKFTFGPSIKDLIQVKLTFDKLFGGLRLQYKEGDTWTSGGFSDADIGQLYGWDDDSLKKCTEGLNYAYIKSPSNANGGAWLDQDLWSKESLFTAELQAPSDGQNPTGIIRRKSYAHFILSSAPMIKRLVFSQNLLEAIKECFDSLSNTLVEQGYNAATGNNGDGGINLGEQTDKCDAGCDRTIDIDVCYCPSECGEDGYSLGALYDVTQYESINRLTSVRNFGKQCANNSILNTSPVCTNISGVKTLEQLIIATTLTSAKIQAHCTNAEGTPGSCAATEADIPVYTIGACMGGKCSCSSPESPYGEGCNCEVSTCTPTCITGESCCITKSYIRQDNCWFNNEYTDVYSPIKSFYESKSNCLLQTKATNLGDTGAKWKVPFLNLNFQEYMNACLQGTPPKATITIPEVQPEVPYDPLDPDDPNNPSNGGGGNKPKPGGGSGKPNPSPEDQCPDIKGGSSGEIPTTPGLYYSGEIRQRVGICTYPCLKTVGSATISSRCQKDIYNITQSWVKCSNAFWEFRKDPDAYNVIEDLSITSGTSYSTSTDEVCGIINGVSDINSFLRNQNKYYYKTAGMTPILRCSDGSNLYYVPQNASLPIVSSNFYFSNKSELKTDSADGDYYQVEGESNIPGFRRYYGHVINTTIGEYGASVTCYAANLPPIPGGEEIWSKYGDEAKSIICDASSMPECKASSEGDTRNYTINKTLSVSLQVTYDTEGSFSQI